MRTAKILPIKPPAPGDMHPVGCRCTTCEPYVPSVPRLRDAALPVLLALAAGILAGIGLAALYDALVPGLQVGLGVVFGS